MGKHGRIAQDDELTSPTEIQVARSLREALARDAEEEQDLTDLCQWVADLRYQLDTAMHHVEQQARELERVQEAHGLAVRDASDARKLAAMRLRAVDRERDALARSRALDASNRAEVTRLRERADYVSAVLSNVRSIVGPAVAARAILTTSEMAAIASMIPEEDEN